MKDILFTWIGATDLRAPKADEKDGVGPIANALDAYDFSQVIMLSNYKDDPRVPAYIDWLVERGLDRNCLTLVEATLTSPIHFSEIYHTAENTVEESLIEGRDTRATFHLSPGTPTMAAAWILLGKGRFPGTRLIQSSLQQGVVEADIPFDIATEFAPSLSRAADTRLQALGAGLPPLAPQFEEIIHESLKMKELVTQARIVARRDVPVLIEGETGTGKELFARAIHAESNRSKKDFVAVNCGAIPRELVEAEFFGYKAGAFSGAQSEHAGYFEKAHGGTIFLDELGELPLDAQAKILRVIQEKKVTRIGETHLRPANVRIIAATNRKLVHEVEEGRFRSDLFFRLAVAVLELPPLRERKGDLGPLVDCLLQQVNEDFALDPSYEHKKLSVKAKNLLLKHTWPGNVRELLNTLTRICVWSPGNTIGEDDVRQNLLPAFKEKRSDVLEQDLGEGFNIKELLDNIARNYIDKALKETGGNKTRAASLLGFPSYQTLDNWMKKLGLKS